MSESAVLNMTSEQMHTNALGGFFVIDAERNLVYCPQGEVLRQKSVKRNGNIRYCNKLACKRCKNGSVPYTSLRRRISKAVDARKKDDLNCGSNNTKSPGITAVKKGSLCATS